MLPSEQLISILPIFLVFVSGQDIPVPKFKPFYDYIIVGAGSAGSIVARRLSEKPEVSVLLIEAGTTDEDRPETMIMRTPAFLWQTWNMPTIAWQFLTEPQKNAAFGFKDKKLSLPRGKVLGGSFAINGMVYQRGSPHIYDEWDKRAGGGTKWSYKDALQYFKKIEDINMESPYNKSARGHFGPLPITQNKVPILKSVYEAASEEIGLPTISCNEGIDIGYCSPQLNIKNGERWNSYRAYLRPVVLERPNLDILINTQVSKVLISPEKKVTGVEFLYYGTPMQVYAMKEVILSAGVYQTPQILMLSGIGPAKHLKELGIKPVVDLPVGQGLKEHTAVPFRFFCDQRTLTKEDLTNARAFLTYFTQRKGILADVAGLEGFAFVKTTPASISGKKWPDAQIEFVSTLLDKAPDVLARYNVRQDLIDTWFAVGRNKSFNGFQMIIQLIHPKSVGEVKLRSTNPADPPLIDPHHLSNIEDVIEYVKVIRILEQYEKTKAFKKINAKMDTYIFPACDKYPFGSDKYYVCFVRALSMGNNHPTSTCKMGHINDPTTVVDPVLRVKGVTKLRVVDASVIPEPTENPNAAVMMIAEQGSDYIIHHNT